MEDVVDPVAATRALKARLDEARSSFEAYLGDAIAAETQRMHHDHDAARSLALQTGMESRRLTFEMRLSDWQQANFEAAELRNQEERTRHAADARAAAERETRERERAHGLNRVLTFCGIVGVFATIVSSVGTGLQAYAAMRSPPSAIAASAAPVMTTH